MNYRHAFHAGNFADVLKHAVLALILKHLGQKPKPYRVIDTHAGLGYYRLDSEEAQRSGEWRHGIGRLIGADVAAIPPDIGLLLDPYLDVVRSLNPEGHLTAYPGSPALALALMRPDDRLIANELHPEDATALRRAIATDFRAKVLSIDGWQALKALLPPKERRGVVLIDPPFEVAGEFSRLSSGLSQAVARFATGTYLLWFPVKNERAVIAFRTALDELGLDKILWCELRTEAVATAEHLVGTGLIVLNPPFKLEQQLATLLPFLAAHLASGEGASWRLDRVGRPPRHSP